MDVWRVMNDKQKTIQIRKYKMILGQDRNEPDAVTHIYEGNYNDPGRPYCARGWNRDNGYGYSIFRGLSTGCICKICSRRYEEGRDPVEPRDRKTKWL